MLVHTALAVFGLSFELNLPKQSHGGTQSPLPLPSPLFPLSLATSGDSSLSFLRFHNGRYRRLSNIWARHIVLELKLTFSNPQKAYSSIMRPLHKSNEGGWFVNENK